MRFDACEAGWDLPHCVRHIPFPCRGLSFINDKLTPAKQAGIFVWSWVLESKLSAPKAIQKLPGVAGQFVVDVIWLGFEPKTHSLEGCCSIQLSYQTRHPQGIANLASFTELSKSRFSLLVVISVSRAKNTSFRDAPTCSNVLSR